MGQCFNLKHIFSSDELGEGNKGLTDNLMDYSNGEALYKHQWDLIHDPSFVGWFEGDDEDAMLVQSALDCLLQAIIQAEPMREALSQLSFAQYKSISVKTRLHCLNLEQ